MAAKFAREVGNIDVLVDKLVPENIGKVHVVGLTTDQTDFEYLGLEDYDLGNSILEYGGPEKLGEVGKTQVHRVNDKFIITVGLGVDDDFLAGSKFEGNHYLLERIRNAVGDAYQAAAGIGVPVDVTINGTSFGIESLTDVHSKEQMFGAIVDAATRSGYQAMRKIDTSDEGDSKVTDIGVLVENPEELEDTFTYSSTLARAENLAREVFEAPHNIMTPYTIVDLALEIASKSEKLTAEVTYKEKFEGGGTPWAALSAVARASPEAALIKVEHRGNPDSDKKLAAVGKGLIFDTGGVSLKPSEGMPDMNGDKGGAATVVGIISALSETDIPINIDFYIPVTENNVGSEAYKPGEIIYMGEDFPAIEVNNTDAEGRMVMATAVALASQDENVEAIMDYSTLTGAMAIATASWTYGIISDPLDQTSVDITKALMEAGEVTHEMFTHFISDSEQAKRIRQTPEGRSKYPTVSNTGPGRPGMHYDGFWFLKAFAGEKPLVHVDMAGALDPSKPRSYMGPNRRFNTPPVMAGVKALETIAENMYN